MDKSLLQLFERREFFNHCLPNLTGSARGDGTYMENTCPCCGYPTLSERSSFEICQICDWEDDGQDDYNADEKGGPNAKSSLAQNRLKWEARFQKAKDLKGQVGFVLLEIDEIIEEQAYSNVDACTIFVQALKDYSQENSWD